MTRLSPSSKQQEQNGNKPSTVWSRGWNSFQRVYISLSHSKYNVPFCVVLLWMETILSSVILQKVSYTEIDWTTYMQQVQLYQEGQVNYREIRGDTGPLVYPAGFLHLYGIFKNLSNDGTDIFKAQVCFVVLYLMTVACVLSLYTQIMSTRIQSTSPNTISKAHQVWSWRYVMGLLCCSKRLHSIFILRLFNDGPAMLFLLVSLKLFCRNSWNWGCVLFSLAVSVKMNILLFAPGLLLLLLQSQSNPWKTVWNLTICALIQITLAWPFLTTYPWSYLTKAFELDRVFDYKWTVNFKFLSPPVFQSKTLSVFLLTGHVMVLLYLFCYKWIRHAQQHEPKTKSALFLTRQPLSPDYVLYTMFVSNFVGIAFARTLHYQFYVWYIQSIPFLVSGKQPNVVVITIIMSLLEYAFHVYPATPISSALLQVLHLGILVRILVGPVPPIFVKEPPHETKQD